MPVPVAKLASGEEGSDDGSTSEDNSLPDVRGVPDRSEVSSECSTAIPPGTWKVAAVAAKLHEPKDCVDETASQCSTADSIEPPPGLSTPPGLGPPGTWITKATQTRAVGSPECPTAGSAKHFLGTCKPCAFIFRGGCQSGPACSFCHLCRPGEKKQRVKSWKAARKVEQQ